MITNNIKVYGKAFHFFSKRPKLYFQALLPAIWAALIIFTVVAAAVIGFTIGLNVLLINTIGDSGFWKTVIHILSTIVFAAIMFFLAYRSFSFVTIEIGDKIYEKIWKIVETEINGEDFIKELKSNAGIVHQVKEDSRSLLSNILNSLKISLLVLLISIVPVVGTITSLIFGFLATGMASCEDHTLRALHARNYFFNERKNLFKQNRGKTYTFGLLSQLFFMIPVANIFLMPVTVVASTYFVNEVLSPELVK